MRTLRSNVKLHRFLRSLLALCICVLSINIVVGRETSQPQKAQLITKFSFRLVNSSIILIKAKFPEFPDTLSFMLDTGCGGVSLDSTTALQLKLVPEISDVKLTGIAQEKRASFLYNRSLLFPGLQLDSLNFHINDYGFFEEEYGVKIDGILGFPFLKKYIVKIDYDKRLIEVWKPGEIKYPKDGYAFDARVSDIPILDCDVKDSRSVAGKYFFDTGADLCLLMSDKFAKDSSILDNNKKVINTECGGLGGKQNMRFTTVEEMRVGPFVFKKVPAFVFEDRYNVTRYPALGGIIGNDLLRRFNIVFNYPANTIHLTPNNTFKEKFNYSYTGFGIYLVNGKVVVQNVIKGSPAEKAGLKDDDVLFGVKNDFSNNIETYKEIISRATKTLRVSVFRDSKVHNFSVDVESVL